MESVDWDTFATEKPLPFVMINDNDLSGTVTAGLNAALFKSAIDSLNVDATSTVSISNNGFLIDEVRYRNGSINLSEKKSMYADLLTSH